MTSTAEKTYYASRLLVRNLRAKGIGNISASMGLTDLINKVLEINQENTPILTGVRFDTEITCTTTGTFYVGDNINITGVLSAYRDDISQANIDLNGYLQNATVEIYNGADLIGTCTTNSNGEYSYTYIPSQGGTLDLLILFNGNTDYENCNVSKTITVEPFKDILLTSTKDILSAADHEYTTLTAQLVGNNNTPISLANVPVTFSRVICDFDETDVGTGLNKNLGDNYSFSSDGIVKIGDSNNYIEFDYELGQFNAYGDYAGDIGDALNEGDVISLRNGNLYVNNDLIRDTTDYPLLDFTNLYAYTTTGSSSSLYIEDIFAEEDTDSSGTAIATYTAKGYGDIYIKAECRLLIQTFALQDMLFYDDATTDKSSQYVSRSIGNGKSCTISYANNEYHLTANESNVSWYGVSPLSLSTSDNWEFTAKTKSTYNDLTFISVGLAKSGADHIEHILYPKSNPTTYAVYGYGSPNAYLIASTNQSLSINTYYTFKVRLINGEVSFKVYNGETLIIDRTYTLPSNYENVEVYPVVSTFGNTPANNSSNYFKEYSVKPL